MKILVACEYSGIVRDAFIAKGHDAISCDILPTEAPGPHSEGDVFDIINDGWDMMIAFPPCTHLACSGAAWFEKKRADGRQQQGIDFFMAMVNAPIPKIAIENPVGIMSRVYQPPAQKIQPWFFGEEDQKTTCLWLKGLPPLMATQHVTPRFVRMKNGEEMSKWCYDSFINLKGKERAHARSKTFPGIAQAMADQWG
jgi:hypothetical protein